MSVFLEIRTVRNAIVLAKSRSVAARKSSGTTVGLVWITCAKAAVSVAIKIEVRHHVAGPVVGTIVVRETGIAELEDKAIHAVRAVVCINIADFTMVA